MTQAFKGVDTLVLVPTKSAPGARCVEHSNALEAAAAAQVRRVVFLSIQCATPDSLFKIAPFILFAESATRLAGMEWTIARMSLFSDPLLEWLPEFGRSNGRLPYTMRDARIAFVSKKDVARGLAAIARSGDLAGRILDLTGPRSVTMPELAAEMGAALGRDIRYERVSDAEFTEICQRDGSPAEMVRFMLTLYQAAEAQEFSRSTRDIEGLTGIPAETVQQALTRLSAAGAA